MGRYSSPALKPERLTWMLTGIKQPTGTAPPRGVGWSSEQAARFAEAELRRGRLALRQDCSNKSRRMPE